VRTLALLTLLLAVGPARAASGEASALERLQSEDAAARETACAELGHAATRGPRVYPALFLAMDRDLSERVRLAAAKALITFPGDDADRRVRAFFQSEPGAGIRLELVTALSTEPAHLDDTGVTDQLSMLMFDDPSPQVRRAAALGLTARGDRRALPAVRRVAVNDADKAVREAAKLAVKALSVPVPVRPTTAFKPKPPKPDAVKGRDPCPAPWGWCECGGPIKRPAKCLERGDCRVELDTMLQLGMPCSWNGVSFDAPQ
jgi:hypothetical protein